MIERGIRFCRLHDWLDRDVNKRDVLSGALCM
jgi:hypothetical protein